MVNRLYVQLKDRLVEVFSAGPPALRLTTERLLLREFEGMDAHAVLTYRGDPEVLRYLSRVEPDSLAEVQQLIHCWREIRRHRIRYVYELAITLSETAQLIGEIGLSYMPNENPEEPPDSACVGFLLHRDYWGQGYATEAARAVVRFAFDELGLKRVFGGCHPENAASRRVLEKAGLHYEGTRLGFPGAPEGMESPVFCLSRVDWLAGRLATTRRIRPRAASDGAPRHSPR